MNDLAIKEKYLNKFVKVMVERLKSGNQKYGDDWLRKDCFEEAEFELYDLANYAYLVWLKLQIRKVKVATDYDGVFHRVKPLLESFNIKPIILTGRPPSEKKLVETQLKGCQYQELINYPYEYGKDLGETLKKISEWKAKKLKELKVDVFIDDDIRYLLEAKKKNQKLLCLLVI